MSVFVVTFAALALSGIFLAYNQHKRELSRPSKDGEVEAQDASIEAAALSFRRNFLIVYVLIMASDWLQGPYIYTLYKDQKKLEESVVAALYATGFVSAAISASFVGAFADRHGRKRFCLVFCGVYALSCLSMASDDLIIMFLGRLLGGVGTTLLYSVFESWMISDYAAKGLERSSLTMTSMFGTMTTLNGLVAIMSGVVGEAVVSFTGTKTSPFIAAILCIAIAAYLMHSSWIENYGDSGSQPAVGSPLLEKSGLQIIRSDRRILVLGLISTCVEGSMYLFVFFWSAGLKAAASAGHGSSRLPSLPFGVIFASFMASMMLGSLCFSISTRPPGRPSPLPFRVPFSDNAKFQQLSKPANLLAVTVAVSAFSLLFPLVVRTEALTFWSYCLFEGTIGIYFPSIFSLKASLIPDGVRAKVYTIMRIPTNIFVLTAHSLSREGDEHRHRIFMFCGCLLIIATIAASRYLEDGNLPLNSEALHEGDFEINDSIASRAASPVSDEGKMLTPEDFESMVDEDENTEDDHEPGKVHKESGLKGGDDVK